MRRKWAKEELPVERECGDIYEFESTSPETKSLRAEKPKRKKKGQTEAETTRICWFLSQGGKSRRGPRLRQPRGTASMVLVVGTRNEWPVTEVLHHLRNQGDIKLETLAALLRRHDANWTPLTG
jgi:hypothetical protein